MSESQRTVETFPIIGMHFRPPAKALIAGLPTGTPLWLQLEPDNPFDANAVKVMLAGSAIAAIAAYSEAIRRKLVEELSFFGSELEQVVQQDELHLGYVPRGLAAGLAMRMAQQDVTRLDGNLTFSTTGTPQTAVPASALKSLDACAPSCDATKGSEA